MRLEKRPRVLVSDAAGREPVTREHPAGVGVGDEHRAARRIEKDGVGRLRPQTGHPQHLASQRPERRPAQPTEIAVEAREQPAGEVEQPPRLEPIGTGGPDQWREPRDWRCRQAFGNQQAASSQRLDGPRGAAPRRVLGQDRAHGDFEQGHRRPPALGTVVGEQRAVEPQQTGLHGIAWRAGNAAPGAQHRAG